MADAKLSNKNIARKTAVEEKKVAKVKKSYYSYLRCKTLSKAGKTETCNFFYEYDVNSLQRYHNYSYYLRILLPFITNLVFLR